MRILVTGAAGYLGTGIVRQLCDDGQSVIASCRSKSELIDNRADIVIGDIFSMKNPYEALGKPEVLLHLAWEKGFSHNNPSHISNISQHYEFLKKMIGGGISRVAVMGTMHEIGFFEGPIKEDTPTNPLSFYGVAKNALCRITSIMCDPS